MKSPRYNDISRVVEGAALVLSRLAQHQAVAISRVAADLSRHAPSLTELSLLRRHDTKQRRREADIPSSKQNVAKSDEERHLSESKQTRKSSQVQEDTASSRTDAFNSQPHISTASATGLFTATSSVYVSETPVPASLESKQELHSPLSNETLQQKADAAKATVPESPPILKHSKTNAATPSQSTQSQTESKRLSAKTLRETTVPSSSISRVLHFGGLAAGLAMGTLGELARRSFDASSKTGAASTSAATSTFLYSAVLSEKNAERLAASLCRMRGAALKLGQMLSIQDEATIPPQVLAALEKVRQGADVMPQAQLEAVLTSELGPHWRTSLAHFDHTPIAAASIGQVHRAVLAPSAIDASWDWDGPPGEVVMKVQYPGVAESIDADLDNLKRLVKLTGVLPKGLFVDHAVNEMRKELKDECDYRNEATKQKAYALLLRDDPRFKVPRVIDSLSSQRVLTTEMVGGVSISEVATMSQDVRNDVAARLLELTMEELFVHRFMQTDPNWGNFLYDPRTHIISLIDFGAARHYPARFVDEYLKLVTAAAEGDRSALIDASINLGFLTGDESQVMLDAHCSSGMIVGEPFATSDPYDFRAARITERIQQCGTVMLKHRLTPPPPEAYTLHRKLSGAFLLCMKLGAVIPCRDPFLNILKRYRYTPDLNESEPAEDALPDSTALAAVDTGAMLQQAS